MNKDITACPVCGERGHFMFMGTDDELEHSAKKYGISKADVFAKRTCGACGAMYIVREDGTFDLIGLKGDQGTWGDEDFPFEGESFTDFIRKRLFGEE